MNARLSIGFVARQTGCTVPTIRYYEEIGLLQPAARSEAGQRQYDEHTIRRLGFIRRCRDFGFPIEQVRELVGLLDEPDRPCAEARDVAVRHLIDVQRRLEELRALESALTAFVGGCDAACVAGRAVDCTLLEDLADPACKPPAGARVRGMCCGSNRPPG